MGEFLFEGFVHVLLEVGGFDVFNDRGLKKKKKNTDGDDMNELSAPGGG